MSNRFSSIHCWSNWLIWFNLDVNGSDENKTIHWHYKQHQQHQHFRSLWEWTDGQRCDILWCYSECIVVVVVESLFFDGSIWRSSFFFGIFFMLKYFSYPYWLEMRIYVQYMHDWQNALAYHLMCSFHKSHTEEITHRKF